MRKGLNFNFCMKLKKLFYKGRFQSETAAATTFCMWMVSAELQVGWLVLAEVPKPGRDGGYIPPII